MRATKSNGRKSSHSPARRGHKARRPLSFPLPLELQQLEQRMMLSIAAPTSLALGAAPSPHNYATQIALIWQNNDTSPNETGWELERSLSPQGPYAIVHTDSGTTNYVDTGLTPDTTYYYQVVYVGAGGTMSAPSNIFAEQTAGNVQVFGNDYEGSGHLPEVLPAGVSDTWTNGSL